MSVLGVIPVYVALASMAGQPAAPLASEPPAEHSAPPQNTSANTDFERFAKRLEAVDAAMANVMDLRADFEQRRRTPLLKKPLVSKGVVLTKGELVRWDTTAPRASTLVIGHGSIRMFYPADSLVEVYSVGEGFKDLAGAPLPRLSVLKERFDLSPLASDDPATKGENANLLGVLLTPKSQDLRKHVTSVKVLIDEAGPSATKVVMTDPDGEETEIVFSHVQLNGGVRDDEVELSLPDGVKVSKPLGESAASSPPNGGAASAGSKLPAREGPR